MSQDFPDSNPYQNTGGQPTKKKGSSALKIVLIIVGIGGVLCLVCCGGMMFMGYSAMSMGMEMFADVIREEYGDHPVVQEHIGDIETIETDVFNAASYGDQLNPGDLPFKVQGSKGSGSIIVRQGSGAGPDGKPTISGGRLILSDGQEIALD